MKTSIFLFTFLIVTCFCASAQKDYKWGQVEKEPDLPEAFLNADAITLNHYEERQTRVENGLFFSRNITKRKIKILTPKGLDQYGNIIIPKKSGMYISILDARAIKADGRIVDLNANDIKTLDLGFVTNIFNKEKFYLFAIPGLEVGDSFEMVCVQEGNTVELGGNIYLHDYLPAVKASFVLETNKQIPVFSSHYNDMPKPKVDGNLRSNTFTWEMEHLIGLYDDRSSIPYQSLPYFIYELNLDGFYLQEPPPNLKDWRALLKYLNERFLQPKVRNKKKLAEQFDNFLNEVSGSSQIEKLRYFHEYVNNNIDMVKLEKSEQSEGIETLLAKERADFYTLHQIYQSFFKHLGLEAFLASGRSRYLGPIQLDFPTHIQISDYFYVVEVNEAPHLLIPKAEGNIYKIDEIPISLEGTSIYMLNLEDGKTFKQIDLPLSSYVQNLRQLQYELSVFEGTDSAYVKVKEIYKGAEATQFGSQLRSIGNEEDMKAWKTAQLQRSLSNIMLDTFGYSPLSEVPPFQNRLFYHMELDYPFRPLDEKLEKLTIGNWLRHELHLPNVESRTLDYYPLFSNSDILIMVLKLDKPASIVNKDQLTEFLENEAGQYTFKVQKINNQTFIIRSQYIFKAHNVAAKDVDQIIELNQAAQKASGKEMIIEWK